MAQDDLFTSEVDVNLDMLHSSMMKGVGHHVDSHYTTTPRLTMDGLTLKEATATDNLTLKSYSDRLLQTL